MTTQERVAASAIARLCTVHDTTLRQLHGIRVRLRHFRLLGILALLVLATTVPLGLFAGLLIAMSSQQQRAVVERQNVDTARAISIAIDKEVESTMDALAILGSVEDLLRGVFYPSGPSRSG